MALWKVKVKGLRTLLNTDETDEEAKRVSKEIYKLLSNSLYLKYFKNFNRLKDFDMFVDTIKDLNILLMYMYDYCDAERIWIDFE